MSKSIESKEPEIGGEMDLDDKSLAENIASVVPAETTPTTPKKIERIKREKPPVVGVAEPEKPKPEKKEEKESVLAGRGKDIGKFLTDYKENNFGKGKGKEISEEMAKNIDTAIESINSKKDITPGLDIAKKIIIGRIEFLEEPPTVFAGSDARILSYIKSSARRANKLPEVVSQEEVGLFEKYLSTVKEIKGADKGKIERIESVLKSAKETSVAEPSTVEAPSVIDESEKPKLDAMETVVGQIAGDTFIEPKPKKTSVEMVVEAPVGQIAGDAPREVEVKKTVEKPKVVWGAKAVEVVDDEKTTTKERENFYQNTVKKAEAEWEKGKAESLEDFIKTREENFLKQEWQNEYNKKLSALSEFDRRQLALLAHERERIENPQDIKSLFTAGLNLDQLRGIKRAFWGLSTKIKSVLSGEKPVREDEFNKLAQKKIEDRKEEMRKEVRARLTKIYEEIHQNFISERVKGIVKDKLEEPERLRKEKVAQEIPEGERLESLNDLNKKWNKAHKIFESFRDGKKIKIDDENVLDPVKDEKVLKKMGSEFSDQIIDIIDKLTGKNLREEAKKATGRGLRDKKTQEYLTKAVKKIYEEQMTKLADYRINLGFKNVAEELEKMPSVAVSKISKKDKEPAPLEQIFVADERKVSTPAIKERKKRKFIINRDFDASGKLRGKKSSGKK